MHFTNFIITLFVYTAINENITSKSSKITLHTLNKKINIGRQQYQDLRAHDLKALMQQLFINYIIKLHSLELLISIRYLL